MISEKCLSHQWTAQRSLSGHLLIGIVSDLFRNCIVLVFDTVIMRPHWENLKSLRFNTESDIVTWLFLSNPRKLQRTAALHALWSGLRVNRENIERNIDGKIGMACYRVSPNSLLMPLKVL